MEQIVYVYDFALFKKLKWIVKLYIFFIGLLILFHLFFKWWKELFLNFYAVNSCSLIKNDLFYSHLPVFSFISWDLTAANQ